LAFVKSKLDYFVKKFERLKLYREWRKLSQKDFFEQYGINQGTASKYESGTSAIPDELETELAADGLNLHWLATGKGEMLVQDDVFRIPLLTRDQALHFDPVKEISRQKANSGEYPDISLVPIPSRVIEYSTDLRAIRVFDSRMDPVMRSGDIAIIQATGWLGNGIYLYRMGGGLHISYVGFYDGVFHLFDEYNRDRKSKEYNELPYDAQTFQAIGRVRAVVKDMFGFDWMEGKMPPIES
jgi:transcriptional regulator with XRE-family HTH domain